ncbi:DUF4224 domain-containing protein [Methylobacillus flagellatus]|uniref:DUF4224 domain-containing protein n=1 Tax=Methylobacillus flagellatus TaxID=405 RepID=UPI002853F7D0|nr:DUF4224 domain-containing protein [Methylobacillus flagellatus]MDR5170693.1 DUF4224 domain-containing protein [Methylobacillus flagellatus]
MSNLVLTPEELIQLTGHRRSDAQCRELQHMRLEFRIRRDGTIAILRTHVEQELGMKESTHKKPKQIEPNWDALNS